MKKMKKKKKTELHLKIQFVPRSKHSSCKNRSGIITARDAEVIAVCSEIHTKHINTLCVQNVGPTNIRIWHNPVRWNRIRLRNLSQDLGIGRHRY
jgi:hypothetical protein